MPKYFVLCLMMSSNQTLSMVRIPIIIPITMMEKKMIIRERRREGEKEIGRKAFLKCVFAVISLFLIVLFIRPVLSEYYASISEIKEGSLLQASRITHEDARYHSLLGYLYYNLRN